MDLAQVFEDALQISQRFVGKTFPQDSLSDPIRWQALEGHIRVVRIVPIPKSNTPIAKHMRMSATLAVIGSVLEETIFQPTYIYPDFAPLRDTMRTLAANDEMHSLFLRSVLLKLQRLDGTIQSDKEAIIAAAVKQVKQVLAPIFTGQESELQELREALTKFFKFACQVGYELQRLNRRVNILYDDRHLMCEGDEYKTIPFHNLPHDLVFHTDDSEDYEAAREADMLATPRPGHRRAASSNCFTKLIWPSFYLSDKDCSELVSAGYIIKDRYIKKAQEEMKEAPLTGSVPSLRRQSTGQRPASMAFDDVFELGGEDSKGESGQ